MRGRVVPAGKHFPLIIIKQTPTQQYGERRSSMKCVARTAAVFFLFIVLLEALFLTQDGVLLTNNILLPREKFTLASFEILLGALAVFGVTAAIMLVAKIPAKPLQHFLEARPLSLCRIACGLFFILLAFYTASWGAKSTSNAFIDIEALTFTLQNAGQILKHSLHMEPVATISAAIAFPVIGLLLVLLLPPLLQNNSNVFAKFGFPATRILLLAALAVYLYGVYFPLPNHGVVDANSGTTYRRGDLISKLRHDNAGPFTHVFHTLATNHTYLKQYTPDGSVAVAYPPQTTMAEYVKGVDQTSLRRLNIIVILVESLRADQLAVCGGKRVVMPNVEAIASESQIFPDTYTQSSHSNYADLGPLSSHYPLRSWWTHTYPENPPYPRVLIYDILKQLGYKTAVISSQNENWGGMINYLKTGGLDAFLHSETVDAESYIPDGDGGFEVYVQAGKRSGKLDDSVTISEAVKWIDEVKPSPFFIYMNLQNSHVPFVIPKGFERKFSKPDLPFRIGFNRFPPNRAKEVMDVYADSLAYVDAQIGRLVTYLKREGLWDDTCVVVTGDTGQAFYEHGFAAHASQLFNEVMRVPLILRIPGEAPATSSRPAQHIDVPPTLLHALRLPPHPSFQGLDLLRPDFPKSRLRFLVAQSPLAHQYGVIKDQYKLVYDMDHNSAFLFDLEKDPGETINIFSEHPELFDEMISYIKCWANNQVKYYATPSMYNRSYPPKTTLTHPQKVHAGQAPDPRENG